MDDGKMTEETCDTCGYKKPERTNAPGIEGATMDITGCSAWIPKGEKGDGCPLAKRYINERRVEILGQFTPKLNGMIQPHTIELIRLWTDEPEFDEIYRIMVGGTMRFEGTDSDLARITFAFMCQNV
jgi:hypothetical protein